VKKGEKDEKRKVYKSKQGAATEAFGVKHSWRFHGARVNGKGIFRTTENIREIKCPEMF
jgi:hypothetical protein